MLTKNKRNTPLENEEVVLFTLKYRNNNVYVQHVTYNK